METKVCYKCKRELPVSEFKKHSGRKDGLQGDCIDCQKEYRKKHYLKNKQKYLDKSKFTTKRNSDWLKALKKTLSCEICGENHPACLQFHHKDKSAKMKNISLLVLSGCAIQKMKDEIDKCQVVCANCHFKIHWEEKH